MIEGQLDSPVRDHRERELKNEREEGESRTHKEIVRVWNITTNSKEFHEVVKLAMYIAAYLYRDQLLPLYMFGS